MSKAVCEDLRIVVDALQEASMVCYSGMLTQLLWLSGFPVTLQNLPTENQLLERSAGSCGRLPRHELLLARAASASWPEAAVFRACKRRG